MTDHKEYPIMCIDDFLKVPPEKIDDCLENFKLHLEMKRLIDADFKGLIEVAGFVFVDDGETRLSGIEISIEKENAQ